MMNSRSPFHRKQGYRFGQCHHPRQGLRNTDCRQRSKTTLGTNRSPKTCFFQKVFGLFLYAWANFSCSPWSKCERPTQLSGDSPTSNYWLWLSSTTVSGNLPWTPYLKKVSKNPGWVAPQSRLRLVPYLGSV